MIRFYKERKYEKYGLTDQLVDQFKTDNFDLVEGEDIKRFKDNVRSLNVRHNEIQLKNASLYSLKIVHQRLCQRLQNVKTTLMKGY